MSFSKIFSAQTHYLDAHIISVEVDLSKGLYSFSIVGLPDKAVEEAKDRFSAAIKNSGFKSPKQKNQKVVVSLAPAEIKKEGPIFDLAIAIAYLLASKTIDFDPKNKIFLGELSLNGEVKAVKGVLPLVRKAKKEGFKEIYLPIDNIKEGALIDGIEIFGVEHLVDLIYHLDPKIKNIKNDVDEMAGEEMVKLDREIKKLERAKKTKIEVSKNDKSRIDFSHIKGNENAKRGLLIAASGGHNVAMFGPPGTGKTMLAKAFSNILPPLSEEEMFEVTSIHSIAGILEGHLVTEIPFRSPHHTTSYNAVVGGGTFPKPGEITLAHRGVLFLDELPEFERRVNKVPSGVYISRYT
jgi:magnesium chelatase family protein